MPDQAFLAMSGLAKTSYTDVTWVTLWMAPFKEQQSSTVSAKLMPHSLMSHILANLFPEVPLQ